MEDVLGQVDTEGAAAGAAVVGVVVRRDLGLAEQTRNRFVVEWFGFAGDQAGWPRERRFFGYLCCRWQGRRCRADSQ